MIDWKRAQTRLNAAGYSSGTPDGIAGTMTLSALVGYTVARKGDPVLGSIGKQLAASGASYGITDRPGRLAEFLAQTSHETGGYRRFEESMHYSAKRLMAVWPRRFPTLASALPYAWDPSDPDREDVALANFTYGSRMGNEANGTDDNDGWDHRGRGMLQHTGAGEYALLKSRVNLNPDDLSDPAKAVIGALDYWQRRKVNDYCDRSDWTGARKAVNGGVIGLSEVAVIRKKVLGVLT